MAVEVPEEAIEKGAAALHSGWSTLRPDVREWWVKRSRMAVEAAAPLIVAAYLRDMAGDLREVVQRSKEYTHGSLAWSVMNEIDDRAAALGVREDPKEG